MKRRDFVVPPGQKIHLKDFDPGGHGNFKNKKAAEERLVKDVLRMSELQDRFYAADTYSLLIIFQAMDAAGKDGVIKHVMSGLNPQGCQVASFKGPSIQELNHDYLWRGNLSLPERGHIGIFNRSYYEEVLSVRVHPEYLEAQRMPKAPKNARLWKSRYQEINNYEKYLTDNGTRIIKFFLNVSKDEQKKRFLERIENPAKNWKLSPLDVQERAHWDDYQKAYEEMLAGTSTEHAPWHVIPADKKWFSRVAIANVIVETLSALKVRYPELGKDQLKKLKKAHQLLLAEK